MLTRANTLRGLMLALLLAAAPAHAVTVYCAGDANTINTALQHAETTSGITEIHIATGVYDVSNTVLTSGNAKVYGVKLMGGYGPNCGSRSLAPASSTQGNTVLDGGGQGAFLDLSGSLTVEGLQFQNFSNAGGSAVHFVEELPTTVTIRFDIFSRTGLALETGYGAPATLGVYNNLIDQSQPGHDGLDINSVNATDAVNIIGNTIGYADGAGINFCLDPGNTNSNLYNNIVWGNNGGGFDISTYCAGGANTALLVDNIYKSSAVSGTSGSGGNSNSDPLFIGAGNYRLKTTPTLSPAINGGDGNAPDIAATDLDGSPRIVGSAPDIGAYESSYDDTLNGQITVTNANDNGPGSLRDAITQANAVSTQHFINFNIPGSCPQTITLASALPVIKYSMEINGYSQPGTSANSAAYGDNAVRCIVLNGGGTVPDGLVPVFTTVGAQLWVQGLVFEGFHDTGGSCGGAAIALGFDGTAGAIITGNQFGGNLGNLGLLPNDVDITGGTNASIGGAAPQFRNIITGATCSGGINGRGVYAGYSDFFGGATGMKIVNNLIGTDASEYGGGGAARQYNDTDLWIETSGNTISGNVIVNSIAQSGVYLKGAQATGNAIDSNLIGITESFCVTYPFPLCLGGDNAANRAGVRLEGAASGNSITHNTIWNSLASGVEMATTTVSPEQDLIGANSIYANNPTYGGIYTGYPVNFQYNDAQSSVQAQPNRGLNNPTITRAIGGVTSGTVNGTLASTNALYNIEVFASQQCDSSPGYGEGETFLTAQGTSISNAPSGNNGSTSFSIPISVASNESLAGKQITLTATDAAGNTSTFSKCMAYTCDVIFKQGFDSSTGEKCP